MSKQPFKICYCMNNLLFEDEVASIVNNLQLLSILWLLLFIYGRQYFIYGNIYPVIEKCI